MDMSISPDKLREQMESTITTMLPDISEELKSRIKIELKKIFSTGLDEEKSAVEESLKVLNAKEMETLAAIKKELSDIKTELGVEKADVLKVITKNVGEMADALKIDPKFKAVILALPEMRDGLIAAIKDAQDAAAKLKEQLAKTTKNKHEITISATNLIISIVIAFVSAMYVIVQLILLLKG
jgi:hypothetical protein